MKKSSTEKLIASMIRTAIAIIILAIGLACGNTAVHWQEWIPNGDFGTILVTMMYIVSILLIGYGVYLISPIYIGYNIYRWLQKGCDDITIDKKNHENDEEDETVEEEMFYQKIEKLKEKYLW